MVSYRWLFQTALGRSALKFVSLPQLLESFQTLGHAANSPTTIPFRNIIGIYSMNRFIILFLLAIFSLPLLSES